MAGPFMGRYASVTLSSSCTVELLGTWKLDLASDKIDASSFGTVWKKGMHGMIGWTASFDGFFGVSTATGSTGQYTLMFAAINQTKIQDQRYYLNSTGDGTTSAYFFMPNFSTNVTNYSTDAGGYIGNISVGQDKNGLASVSYTVEGYGPLALYVNTSSQGVIY